MSRTRVTIILIQVFYQEYLHLNQLQQNQRHLIIHNNTYEKEEKGVDKLLLLSTIYKEVCEK